MITQQEYWSKCSRFDCLEDKYQRDLLSSAEHIEYHALMWELMSLRCTYPTLHDAYRVS